MGTPRSLPKPSVHWLPFFIPVTVALDCFETVTAPVGFSPAVLAIVPIAALVVRATEQFARL